MADYQELTDKFGILPTKSQIEKVNQLNKHQINYKFVGKMVDGTLMFKNMDINEGNLMLL
jgi:hypothetical protein